MANGLLNQLLAYWTLNESSGNRADSTGNGNTMVQTGSVTGASGFGNVGNVSVWPGTSGNYLSGTSLVSSGNWTIAGWINLAVLNATQAIFGQAKTASTVQQGIRVQTSNVLQFWVKSSLLDGVAGTTVLTSGTWYHLAFTYDSATHTKTLYLNGNIEASGSSTSAVYTSNTTIYMGTTSGTTQFLNGSLVGWGVWSRVLSATDISNLYNGGNGVSFSMLDNGAAPAIPKPLQTSLQGGVGAYGGLTVPERFVGKLPSPKVRSGWGPNRGSARDGEGLLAQLREAKDRGAEERELVELLTLLEMTGVL